ncbi:plasmid replication protein RepC [Rhizobium sp. SIMBA_035]
MDTTYVTTPVGRRPMTLAMMLAQHKAGTLPKDQRRNKWKLFRSVCEARRDLCVSDRALTVLDALLTFLPDDDLSGSASLVVFPSNVQLSLRARGMTPATLRRHLAMLVDAGLIARKDSPNGKRYARRGKTGEIDEAFGFNLAPLLARADEIEALAERRRLDREHLRLAKERLSICRRDIGKLIAAAALEEAPGDWSTLFEAFRCVVDGLPRQASLVEVEAALRQLEHIRSIIVNQLENHVKAQNTGVNGSQNERHIQDSDPESLFEIEAGNRDQQIQVPPANNSPAPMTSYESAPSATSLDAVLKACPQVNSYGPGGAIRNWQDLVAASEIVRTMLGISRSAYHDAVLAMGADGAAIVTACILEGAERINSPGGYLRSLTLRARHRSFKPGPMIQALLRSPRQ